MFTAIRRVFSPLPKNFENIEVQNDDFKCSFSTHRYLQVSYKVGFVVQDQEKLKKMTPFTGKSLQMLLTLLVENMIRRAVFPQNQREPEPLTEDKKDWVWNGLQPVLILWGLGITDFEIN